MTADPSGIQSDGPPGAESDGPPGGQRSVPAGGVPPEGDAPDHRPSGLRNPVAAVRGMGAATLVLEALVLVLAIQPIRVLGAGLTGAAVGAVVALAIGAVGLAGSLRRGWAWQVGTVFQGTVLLAGLLHWSLVGVGVLFGLVWGYVLHVRRVILG